MTGQPPDWDLDNLSDEVLQKAVALYYDGENAPTISAKGVGSTADEIIAIANQHEVPLCNNAQLVDLLVTLELGDDIPTALYTAVAYIIAFAYEMEGKRPDTL